MTFSDLFGHPGGGVSETEARAYIETMLILAVADGGFADEETMLLTQMAMRHPRIAGLGKNVIEQVVSSSLNDMIHQGAETRIQAIADMLPHQGQRIEALKLGLAIAIANRVLDAAELEILDRFQAAFGLSDSQIRQILNSFGE